MSRTDNHRPHHAMAQDPTMRKHFDEVHDHRDGICDFEIFMAEQRSGRWIRTSCYLMWTSNLRVCQCRNEGCSAQPRRREIRRQERAAGRRDTRTAEQQAAAGDLDEDFPTAPQRRWPY